jgi:hypothetical protein
MNTNAESHQADPPRRRWLARPRRDIALAAGAGVLALLLAGGKPGPAALLLVAVAAYWAPAAVAYSRHARAPGQVAVVNLFLGWTFIGWVVALAMAFRDPAPPPQG